MKNQIYVTYGFGNVFDPNKLNTNLREFIGKPLKAWWGSPIDADFGWKEWCENEEFLIDNRYKSLEEYFSDNNKIFWTLKDNAKVLMINNINDLNTCIESQFIYYDSCDYFRHRWDFYQILRKGYSAIQLNDAAIGHCFRSTVESIMNGWDCESIVVLDPSMIIQLFDEKLNKVKWLYRLESKDPNNGLWYNTKGDYVWGCKDCKGEAKNLPMGYDDRYHIDGKNWFSSCSKEEDLLHWYSKEDAEYLLEHGFVFTKYLAKDYHEFQLETVFLKETAISRQEISFEDLF